MQTLQFISAIQIFIRKMNIYDVLKCKNNLWKILITRLVQNVKYIEAPYEPHKFVKMVKDKELADEKKAAYVVPLVLKCVWIL